MAERFKQTLQVKRKFQLVDIFVQGHEYRQKFIICFLLIVRLWTACKNSLYYNYFFNILYNISKTK